MNRLYEETQNNNWLNNLKQAVQKMNVPQDIQNNPHSIVDYLVQSGRVSQDRLNQAMQIAQNMGIKL